MIAAWLVACMHGSNLGEYVVRRLQSQAQTPRRLAV